MRTRSGVLYLADLQPRVGNQSRAIDNRRLVRALKPLPRSILAEVVEKLRRLGEL